MLMVFCLQSYYSNIVLVNQCQKAGLEPVYEWLGVKKTQYPNGPRPKRPDQKGSSQKGPLFDPTRPTFLNQFYINL